jgi:hypothetical protein
MSTFKQFSSECSNCATEKIVKILDFVPPNVNKAVPFDNYRHGVHVLDHDVSAFKKIGCEQMMKCIAQPSSRLAKARQASLLIKI